MINKAIKGGLSPERIARALNKSPHHIRASQSILEGISPDVIEMLKTRPICSKALRHLKRVLPLRQIEMAELMIAANNFAESYVQALLIGTRTDMLRNPRVTPKHLTRDAAKMEAELESIEKDFKGLEESYGETVINLTLAQRYIKKLIENPRVLRFMNSKHSDILSEFQSLAAMDSI